MWMDIAVVIMAVVAFGAGAVCYVEGLKDHDNKSEG